MSTDSLTIRSSCGTFTKIKDTDKVIKYLKEWAHTVDDTSELWELITMRLLRYAVKTGEGMSLSADNSSLIMFLGDILNKIAHKKKEVFFYEAWSRFSNLFESVKFWSEFKKQKDTIINYSVGLAEDIMPQFIFLHKRIDSDSNGVRLKAINCPLDQVNTIIDQLRQNSMVLIYALKKSTEHIPELFESLKKYDPRNGGSALLVFRVFLGGDQYVWNIHGKKVFIPGLYNLLSFLKKNGWHLRYRFIRNFDSDFILPQDGVSGICILNMSNDPDGLINFDGSKEYHDDTNSFKTTEIAIFNEKNLQQYDSAFNYNLPIVFLRPEPDWKSWSEQYGWDDTEIDWMGAGESFFANQLLVEYKIDKIRSSMVTCIDYDFIDDSINILLQCFEEKILSRKNFINLLELLKLKNISEKSAEITDWFLSRNVNRVTLQEYLTLFEKLGYLYGIENALIRIATHQLTTKKAMHKIINLALQKGYKTVWNTIVPEYIEKYQDDYELRMLWISSIIDLHSKVKLLEVLASDLQLNNSNDIQFNIKVLSELGIAYARKGDMFALKDCSANLVSLSPNDSLGLVLSAFADFRLGGNSYKHIFEQVADSEGHHPYSILVSMIILSELGIPVVHGRTFEEYAVQIVNS